MPDIQQFPVPTHVFLLAQTITIDSRSHPDEQVSKYKSYTWPRSLDAIDVTIQLENIEHIIFQLQLSILDSGSSPDCVLADLRAAREKSIDTLTKIAKYHAACGYVNVYSDEPVRCQWTTVNGDTTVHNFETCPSTYLFIDDLSKMTADKHGYWSLNKSTFELTLYVGGCAYLGNKTFDVVDAMVPEPDPCERHLDVVHKDKK